VLRIGKPVGNLMQVILAVRKILNEGSRKPHETKPLLGFKAGKDSLLILYYLCDHLVWLSRVKRMLERMTDLALDEQRENFEEV